MISLSPDQQKALDSILDWFYSKNRSRFITLGGYAGTGKTTLTSRIRQLIKKKNSKTKIAFCSFTGKATRVLQSKLQAADAVYSGDSISTIHSLIYSPQTNAKNEIVGWERKEKIDADLIIVDEASMVDRYVWDDLLFYNVPILAIGDHGQLAPIRGSFNLMEEPIIRLEEIHRQARGNPIIEVSMLARTEGEIPAKIFGKNIMKLKKGSEESRETISELLESYNSDTLILCGYNTTRVKVNQYVRKALEFESANPEPGDRVICLRNNHEKRIFNGMIGTIRKISYDDKDWYSAKIDFDQEADQYSGLIFAHQFNNKDSANFTSDRALTMVGDLFDFGYALTVHKAQGSQARRVVLFEERFAKMSDDEWRRWLYTAVTRAEEELFVVGN